MIELNRILLYPIKSLDGVEVSQATLLASGALRGDREFAIVDAQGKVVNGKRTAAVHPLRAQFTGFLPSELNANRTVTLSAPSQHPQTFDLEGDRTPLSAWLSQYFGFSVQVLQNRKTGFPDDTDSPAATVIGTATIETVAHWFPSLSPAELRRRLRTNLELTTPAPFWEDRLFSTADAPLPFQLGAIQFLGVNPCQRCIVPTRDAETGAATPQFQKIFLAQRRATLPDWAEASRFNHYYRLAVNTRCPPSEVGKKLQVGDRLTL
jgi:uncharacterized protein